MKPKLPSDRSFGMVFFGFFVVIGSWPLLYNQPVRLWSYLIAAAFFIVALIIPKILRPLNRLWMKFGLLLNRVVSPIVMALLFFLTLLPIGILMRLFGKKTLELEFKPDKTSYWINRDNPGPEPESIKNQY